jgi:hypothetical protein
MLKCRRADVSISKKFFFVGYERVDLTVIEYEKG